MILLSHADLSIAAAMVIMLALLSLRLQAGISRQLLVAALRTAVQLTLIGLVLKTLFANVHLGWVSLLALFMLLVAGREVMARQVGLFHRHRFNVPVVVYRDGVCAGRDPRRLALVCTAIRDSAAWHAAGQYHERYRHRA